MWPFKSKNKTTWETKKLGELLKNYGWHVDYEKYDGHKHIDIAIVDAKMNIEVDGCQHNLNFHQALSDLQREYYSFVKGYITLRIPNSLIKNHTARITTAEFLNKFLEERRMQLK